MPNLSLATVLVLMVVRLDADRGLITLGLAVGGGDTATLTCVLPARGLPRIVEKPQHAVAADRAVADVVV